MSKQSPAFHELDIVALKHPLKEPLLTQGSQGTIVQKYSVHDFAVEFLDKSGHTVALTDLSSKDLRLVWSLSTQAPSWQFTTRSATKTTEKDKYWATRSPKPPKKPAYVYSFNY